MNDLSKSELNESLFDTLRASELNEVVGDALEIALDSVLEEGILKEIPIISAIVRLGKTTVAIRDRILVKKLLLFLRGISEVSQEERAQFVSKLETNHSFRTLVGETLILLIDRHDHLGKPEILAKIFNGYIREEIDYDTYLRLATSVDKTFIEDLRSLFEYYSEDRLSWSIDSSLWEKFYPSGLSQMNVNIQVEHDHANILTAYSEYPIEYVPNEDSRILAKLVLGDKLANFFKRF
jgi:hypothetical protein